MTARVTEPEKKHHNELMATRMAAGLLSHLMFSHLT
jgi:hypothetical protein